tara:strand:- start:315 stop:803 length:489 start_codon:yes stop_codon:yes gene_type:complete
MLLTSICPPALLYLGFSLTQILIDTVKGLYNVAFFKFLVMIIFTILLNALCGQGLGIISWFVVMVPFVSMTFITTLLMFVFDVQPDSGDSVQYVYDKAPPSKSSDKKTSKDSDASNKDHEAHSIVATPQGEHDMPSHLTDMQSNGPHADVMNHDGHHSVATV